MNSRRKGKGGELELAKKLREYGYDCRRGQQYCGANGDADVVGIPGVHIECKRTNRINVYDLWIRHSGTPEMVRSLSSSSAGITAIGWRCCRWMQ